MTFNSWVLGGGSGDGDGDGVCVCVCVFVYVCFSSFVFPSLELFIFCVFHGCN